MYVIHTCICVHFNDRNNTSVLHSQNIGLVQWLPALDKKKINVNGKTDYSTLGYAKTVTRRPLHHLYIAQPNTSIEASIEFFLLNLIFLNMN